MYPTTGVYKSAYNKDCVLDSGGGGGGGGGRRRAENCGRGRGRHHKHPLVSAFVMKRERKTVSLGTREVTRNQERARETTRLG